MASVRSGQHGPTGPIVLKAKSYGARISGWHSLPNEVLAMIFRRVPTTDESLDDTRRNLSHVCSLWRALVLHDSFFWAEIELCGSNTVDRLNDRLPRSGSWPLTLRINATRQRLPGVYVSLPATLDTLKPHMSRLRVLELQLAKVDLPSSDSNQVDASSWHQSILDAPLLDELSLMIKPPTSLTIALDIRTPRVRALTLHGVRPKDWSLVLSAHTESVNVQQGFTTAASTLHGIISRCPSLRKLYLAAPLLRDFDSTAYADLKPLSLKKLNLMLIDEQVMTNLLQLSVLNVSSIPHVSIAYPSGAYASTAVGALLAGFGPVEWVHLSDHIVEVGNAAGFTRDVTTVRRRILDDWSSIDDFRVNGAFETAAAVMLAPRHWRDLVRADPLCNQALHLTLLLEPGDFTSNAFKWDPVACASLARLTLRCSDEDGTTTVEKEDIEHIFDRLGHRTEDVQLDRVMMAPDKDEKINRLMQAWDDLERDRRAVRSLCVSQERTSTE